jgi:ribulose kinase
MAKVVIGVDCGTESGRIPRQNEGPGVYLTERRSNFASEGRFKASAKI